MKKPWVKLLWPNYIQIEWWNLGISYFLKKLLNAFLLWLKNHKIWNLPSYLVLILSGLHTQRGAWTQNPEMKSCMLYWLSQSGAPILTIFKGIVR